MSFKWRVKLSSIKLRRLDEVEEDDFKTWALTTVTTAAGPCDVLWYACPDGRESSASAAGDPNANLGKTSVCMQ